VTNESSTPLKPGALGWNPETSDAVKINTTIPNTSQPITAIPASRTANCRAPPSSPGSAPGSGATHQAASTSRPTETAAARSCAARAAGKP
jgi:hypothetical protein